MRPHLARRRRGIAGGNRLDDGDVIADGLVDLALHRQVQAAQADGRWDAAYAPQRQAAVPPDLEAALEANAAAADFFARLDGANRFAVLYRVQEPKLPATRARRIEQLVAMLARGETIHPRPARRGQGDLK